MSNRNPKTDSRQRSLFDYIQGLREAEGAPAEGGLNIREALKCAMNEAIKGCPLSRHQIAGEMSHLLGVEISKTTIDAWTAESKAGHRMPAEYLPAFCAATNNRGPLSVITEAAGVFALPGPDAIRSEIQRLSDEERKARSEKRKRMLLLTELERGAIATVGERRNRSGRRLYDKG